MRPFSSVSARLLPLERRTTDRPKSVAVLGGGITGLSAAWYLSKFAPGLPITVYEKSRPGGWLRTTRIKCEHGTVQFEEGPRTIRPWTASGLVTIDMIRQLGLESELVLVPKTSQAAKNRYIYYPDRLNRLPNSILSVLLSPALPAMKGVLGGILSEPFRKRRPTGLEDESVGSFLTRRFNSAVANNLASAVLHGIYAGDVNKLSAKSLFPGLWAAEASQGSLFKSFTSGRGMEEHERDRTIREELQSDNAEICARMEGTSVFSFREGIETLVSALLRDLREKPNVTVKPGSTVSGIEYNIDHEMPVQVLLAPHVSHESHSHVISTLPAPALASLLPPSRRPPSLEEIPFVTVLVVNLFFPTPNLLPVSGFGYLIPNTTVNPERALGVIFDSDYDTSACTKVTVMFGGHYWTDNPSIPTNSQAIAMAREVLRRHLDLHVSPALTNVALQKDCIPQYTVGHDERLRRAHEDLKRGFGGRVSVAGSSYRGVGVNDCVRSARDVAVGVVGKGDVTGLEGIGR